MSAYERNELAFVIAGDDLGTIMSTIGNTMVPLLKQYGPRLYSFAKDIFS
jgi:hypothetical protein